MLVEITVANFRSFKQEQTLSLVSSGGKDRAHRHHLIPYGNSNLLKAASIHGANASGKSNLISAMRVMQSFIKNSATHMNQGDHIPGMVPFRLDPACCDQPSFFSASIVIDQDHYAYSFSATAKRVHTEKLIVSTPGKPQRVWFDRHFDEAVNQTKWKFGGPIEIDREILEKRTRANGLALSRGAEMNIEALNDLFLWFRDQMWVFDLSSLPIVGLAQETAGRIEQDPELRSRVTKLLKHADFGIDGIRIDEQKIEKEHLSELKELLSNKAMQVFETQIKKSGPSFNIHSLHQNSSHEQVEFNFREAESNGTKRFFALAGPFLDAIDKGTVMVVDELECSMHPLLTRKLVQLFQSPDVNKNGAQLIFATHDSVLMDPGLFRRDQIWLVEKNNEGASELFSLYDFDTANRPRNQEAFQRNYLAGRYGGTPKFGSTFEDLELP